MKEKSKKLENLLEISEKNFAKEKIPSLFDLIIANKEFKYCSLIIVQTIVFVGFGIFCFTRMDNSKMIGFNILSFTFGLLFFVIYFYLMFEIITAWTLKNQGDDKKWKKQ